MDWRALLRDIDGKGCVPAGSIAKLTRTKADEIRAWIAAGMATTAAGSELVEENGEYFLTEAQALALAHKFAPRRGECRVTIVLAFVAQRMRQAGHEASELNSFGRTLTELATTPLGLAALRCEAEKVLASA